MAQKQNKSVEERREQYNDTEISYDNYTDKTYFEDEFRGKDENCVFRMVFGEKENNNLADLRTFIHIYEGFDGDKILYIDGGAISHWVANPDFEYDSDFIDCIENTLINELEFYEEKGYNTVDETVTVLIDELDREEDVLEFAREISELE